MKKIIITIVVILAFTTVNAQEETVSNAATTSNKPNPGNLILGFGIKNLTDVTGTNIGAAYALNSNTNVRFGLNFNIESTTTEVADKSIKNSFNDVNIYGGIEKYFSGTSKLAPYYGFQASLGLGGKSNTDSSGTKTTVSNPTKLGADGFVGFAYFFTKHVYIGAETSLGLRANIGKNETSYNLGTHSAKLTCGFVLF